VSNGNISPKDDWYRKRNKCWKFFNLDFHTKVLLKIEKKERKKRKKEREREKKIKKERKKEITNCRQKLHYITDFLIFHSTSFPLFLSYGNNVSNLVLFLGKIFQSHFFKTQRLRERDSKWERKRVRERKRLRERERLRRERV